MTTVDYTNATEVEVHCFAADASEIDLGVGEWPRLIPTTLGNRQPFVLTAVERDREGDVFSAVYRQSLGCISLRVFND